MAIKVGNIEVFMGPVQVGAPDDLEKVIVEFIDKAKKSLDIAVQELESRAITEAMIRAKQRKVTVRLVLESDYLSVRAAVSEPFAPGGTNERNRFLHLACLRAKIKVRTDYNSGIFHQKFIIRDGSSVLTGSTNFTPTGVGSNLNHIVIVKDIKVANTYKKEFREIQQGHFGKRNEGHDPKPREVEVSNVPIKILFAPDHAPEMEIMKQIAKAKSRVDFAIFTFSKSSGIDDQMILAMSAGRTVRGVMDGSQANQKWAATHPIHQAGADIYLVRKTGGVNKLHHKLMVLDEQVVIAGSFNYTGPANLINDENIVIFGDLESTKAGSINAQKKIGSFAKAEIDRIIENHATVVV